MGLQGALWPGADVEQTRERVVWPTRAALSHGSASAAAVSGSAGGGYASGSVLAAVPAGALPTKRGTVIVRRCTDAM